MARKVRDSKTDSPSARAKLKPQPEPIWVHLAPGQSLGYFKPKKGAGTWRARVYLPGTRTLKKTALGVADDFEAADGEKVLSYAQAQDKAKEWMKATLETIRLEAGGEVIHKGAFTVDAALEAYFADGERRGVKGLGRDKQRASAWIRPVLGSLEVSDLTRGRLESWLAKIAESPKRVRTKAPKDSNAPVPIPRNFKVPRPAKVGPKPPEAPGTEDEKRARKDSANRVLTTLKAALNFALDRRLVRNGEAWQAVKPFRGTTSSRTRFLSKEDQVRLVKACPEDFGQIVRGALLTGARYGELARVRVADYNDTAGTLFIAESKSGKPRHVVLTDEGKQLFTEVTAGRAASEPIFLRDNAERPKRGGLGNTWGPSDQSRFMAVACKAAKVEGLTFHELRHTYASWLVNAGCPLAYVAAQLGHTDTRMVEKHYGHLAPTAMANAIRAAMPALGLVSDQKIRVLEVMK